MLPAGVFFRIIQNDAFFKYQIDFKKSIFENTFQNPFGNGNSNRFHDLIKTRQRNKN